VAPKERGIEPAVAVNGAVAGLVLGLSGGLSPGPVLTLVVTETLNHGFGSGFRVAIAPLVTDVPIVAAVLLVLSRLAGAETVLGIIALTGAVFLIYLGVHSAAVRGSEPETDGVPSRSFLKGVALNLVNPNPYLFWLTIGGPIVFEACSRGLSAIALFIGFFYAALVGSKIGVALLVSRSRRFLRSRAYLWLNRSLGVVLLIYALHFVHEGLRYLGLW